MKPSTAAEAASQVQNLQPDAEHQDESGRS